MASELAKYIREQIKSGYETSTIRNSLIGQGHSAASVDTAIKEAKQKIPLLWIAIALIIAAIIILTILVYIQMQEPAEQPLTHPEQIKTTEKEAKETPEEKTEGTEKTPLPPAEKMHFIEPEEAKEFESSIKIEDIRKISLTEPDRAEALCTDLKFRTERDNCYLQIAGTAAKPEFCAKISEQTARDQCYLNFAAAGINTCEQIKDETAKKSCNQLISITAK